jgi:hypothetical protein
MLRFSSAARLRDPCHQDDVNRLDDTVFIGPAIAGSETECSVVTDFDACLHHLIAARLPLDYPSLQGSEVE